ncbi:hypothetical protein TNCV_1188331 [Trichonephila clavipes]|nr:hypothetical protein TNCV_1188331 [Trichonephila clavipes]
MMYMSIVGSSVLCKHLFSIAGNIANEWYRLDPSRLDRLLFLKSLDIMHWEIHSHTNNIFELCSVEPLKAKDEPLLETQSTKSYDSEFNDDDANNYSFDLIPFCKLDQVNQDIRNVEILYAFEHAGFQLVIPQCGIALTGIVFQ